MKDRKSVRHIYQSCLVVGAGAWGTALAVHLARNGLHIQLYDHDPARRLDMQQSRENKRYLPGIPFPESIQMIDTLTPTIVSNSDFVLIAVPSSAFEQSLKTCQGAQALLWVTKGFSPSGALLYTLVDHYFPHIPKTLLTGPSFAREVALQHPTAVILASHHLDEAWAFQQVFNTSTFRAYLCDDLIGASLGGAVKNVIAIAVGIATGLGLGANTRAALITRGLAELKRIGLALGAEAATLTGLSGLGDLILTCSEEQSRNRQFGVLLGQGITLKEAQQAIGHVVEGIQTARSLNHLITQHQLYAPISTQVYRILTQTVSIADAFEALLQTTPLTEVSSKEHF